ncbi:hypothetical protein AB6A40_011245 [Gnathostoma spinigerum]|uniref:Phenylalanine zipper domain-containing protein n=1 Tax=Gnathostoma spinigerum TaxID=75299 RepID=A0ABD6F2M5_9BILA
MEDHEPSRWRQFCMQYAKSVAFQFAESWQQFLLNDNSKSDTNVPKEDIVEQFTQTFSEELTKRLLSDNPIRHAPDSSLTDRVLNNYQSATMCCGRSRSFWSSPSEGDQKKGATTLDYKKRSQSDFAFVGRTPALVTYFVSRIFSS